ncbi:hypothetical protein ACFC09_05305 [Streptomyces sp. NPDC056161]|uniref:hypothetical protein n=1 Tax=Streptomyces sp. NPDC056161 TaxID=3345732 RepID=UPI0035DD3121
MQGHEFQPGKLVIGVFLSGAAVAYAGDAGGLWDTPWFAMVPLVVCGLCLAGAAAVLARLIRRRRTATRTVPRRDTGN